MYLYWRIQQDLSCLGEVIRFIDPSFIRCHKIWRKRNMAGLALAEDYEPKEFLWTYLN
ncbi:MAG: hypothetical protein KKC46_19795 [Proteobacteria bacterium]|nr:hypothetical protein [Pseudomonadota bacterium]